MKLLTELMKIKRMDTEEREDENAPREPDVDDTDIEDIDDENVDPELVFDEEPNPDEEDDIEGLNFDDDDDLGEFDDENTDLDSLEGDPEEVPEEEQDPDRAGVIRYVKGAHLVYKREQEDGTYEEMWIYNSGEFKKDMEVKKAIIAGTDIPPNATRSRDGSQEVHIWSAGNADIVLIKGLPQ